MAVGQEERAETGRSKSSRISTARSSSRAKDAVVPSEGTPSKKLPRRPRSAQRPSTSRQLPPKAPRQTVASAQAAALDATRTLENLKEQCIDLKCAANAASKDTLKSRTRFLALERELQKREKILRAMISSHQSGLGIGMEVVEKLREERNMLPLYQRKINALHQELEEREADIKQMKRDPRFTKIIELQVEYASWQHEARRLEHLMEDRNSETPQAHSEVEVNKAQVEKLEDELAAQDKNRERIADELHDTEADHSNWNSHCDKQEAEMRRQQELTRDLAISFKTLLQELKKAEQLQDDTDDMALTRRKYEQDIAAFAEDKKQREKLEKLEAARTSPTAVFSISKASLFTPLGVAASRTKVLCLRRALMEGNSQIAESLFQQMKSNDTDSDGMLSHEELLVAFSSWRTCPVPAEEAVSLVRSLLPESSPADTSLVCWPDVLVVLDRSDGVVAAPPKASSRSSIAAVKAAPEPSAASLIGVPQLRTLRACCLRSAITTEELLRQLLGIQSLIQAEDFFHDLGLEHDFETQWVEIWQRLGTNGLVAYLPLSQASMSASAYQAWSTRCVNAIQAHKKELVDSFAVWREDMMLSQANFSMVCSDVMGASLVEEDIQDLALVAGASPDPARDFDTVDGGWVLRLPEQN